MTALNTKKVYRLKIDIKYLGVVVLGTNNTGSLSTSISGLPFAFSAQVRVLGPNNYRYEHNIPGGWTETLTGLPPGTYTLSPKPVPYAMAPRNINFPAQASFLVIVTAQNTTTQTIPYYDQPTGYAMGGDLAISISGVFTVTGAPSSTQVKVSGPNGYSSTQNISTETAETLTGLAPGTYTLHPQIAEAAGANCFPAWFPDQMSYTFPLTVGGGPGLTITYSYHT
jgi:hypothetical protein